MYFQASEGRVYKQAREGLGVAVNVTTSVLKNASNGVDSLGQGTRVDFGQRCHEHIGLIALRNAFQQLPFCKYLATRANPVVAGSVRFPYPPRTPAGRVGSPCRTSSTDLTPDP